MGPASTSGVGQQGTLIDGRGWIAYFHVGQGPGGAWPYRAGSPAKLPAQSPIRVARWSDGSNRAHRGWGSNPTPLSITGLCTPVKSPWIL
jgi:hypothetical protein